MSFFTWNELFSVNVAKYDSQHMKLVEMINELHQAMITGNAKDILRKIIDELITYTTVHFADEERMMKDYGYPGTAVHKEEHELLVKQVLGLQEQFNSGRTVLTLGVMMFLKNWLMNHIQSIDKKFGLFLNDCGVR